MPQRDPRLLRWLIGAGASLAALAGYVNAVMLTYHHVPVSHMTGAATRVAVDLGQGHTTDLRSVAWLVLGFFVGTVLSGVVLETGELRPGRRYGIVLMIEGAILAAAASLAMRGLPGAVPVAALACGLQNAMASSYSGLTLRTTHVTGIVTDLGIMVGQRLRGQRPEAWKAVLLLSLLGGFVVGGIVGAVVVARLPADLRMASLWAPALACAGGGFVYWAWRAGLARRPA